MHKRVFSLILCLALVLSAFVGCSSGKNDNDDEVDELEERIEELEELLKEKNASEDIKELKEELAEYLDELSNLDEDDEEYEELLEKIEAIEVELEKADKEENTNATIAETISTTIAETFTEDVFVEGYPIAEDKPVFKDDFGGAEFRILTAGQTNGGACNDFGFEQENPEATYLDKAQYKRILDVEKAYNVDIIQDTKEGYSSASTGKPGPGYNLICDHVASGTDMYDLCLIAGYDVSQLATQGFLYNMGMIPGVDLTKSYWDQNAIEDLSIAGLTFFTTGEITVSDNNAVNCIIFNKDLAKEYKIENPYDLVNNNEWTIEKFAELAKKVSEDLNSDGEMGSEDRYGLLVWDDSITVIPSAAGQRCATINEKGEIELTLFNEATLNALDAYADIAYDTVYALQYQRYHNSGSGFELFTNNQGLFMPVLVGNLISQHYRYLENDFGILPYPKLTASQKDYYTTISPFNSQFICVPLVVENINMVGTVTEALAYYGEKDVSPAYFDVTLMGKTCRDAESCDMLDIVFDNVIYDIGYYYQIGEYNKQLIMCLRDYDSMWATMYDKKLSMAQSQLDGINSSYANIASLWSGQK